MYDWDTQINEAWWDEVAADSESFLVQHRFMRFKYHLTLLEMILGAYH